MVRNDTTAYTALRASLALATCMRICAMYISINLTGHRTGRPLGAEHDQYLGARDIYDTSP